MGFRVSYLFGFIHIGVTFMKHLISGLTLSFGLLISDLSLNAACRGGRCGWKRPAPRATSSVVQRPVIKSSVPVTKNPVKKSNQTESASQDQVQGTQEQEQPK